eukprot:1160928-Pelagomonas_calceolata.AAC.6
MYILGVRDDFAWGVTWRLGPASPSPSSKSISSSSGGRLHEELCCLHVYEGLLGLMTTAFALGFWVWG